MATTHIKLSVTVPAGLLRHVGTEMKRSGKSKSAVISEALRAHFEPPASELVPGLVDGPSQEEFDALESRVRQLERLAENSGAL